VGHIISAEGLKPDPEKVRAMKDMAPPETKEDVRSFWDLFSIWPNSSQC